MRTTLVYSKLAGTDTIIAADLLTLLNPGETFTSVGLTSLTPTTTPDLSAILLSDPTDTNLQVTLLQGLAGISYGITAQILTDARTFSIVLAISVLADTDVPYVTQNPDAYTDLVDTIEAGKSAIGTAIFAFPPSVDPTGGFVTWEFLDAQGTTYARGNAYDYIVQSNGVSNTVMASCVINVPSNVPPTLENQRYQLRYTLELSSQYIQEYPQQSTYYCYENITVITLNSVPLGTQPGVELQGDVATLSLVTDVLYDTVKVELYQDNTSIGSMLVPHYERVSSGYYYAAQFDTTNLPVSLESYNVVWSYSNSSYASIVNRESAPLWIVNPTILQAIADVKSKVNKAQTTLYGTPDLLFPPSTILTWLRRARDTFNGSYGVFMAFDMTNAKGSIREYWLMYTELLALESQYIAEGEKSFSFAGAAISLDIDRTGFLDSAASKLQSRLDNEFKPFKQNLIYKGATKGDGSVDPTKLQIGAIGAVGICLTPATQWNNAGRGTIYPQIR